MYKKITPPISTEQLQDLKAGDKIAITGTIITARDAAHKRMINHLEQYGELPLDLEGKMIYYVGPTKNKPGEVIGSAGPTTSGRMDLYTNHLLKQGVKGFIGKGNRSQEVKEGLKKYNGVYMAAVGGAGAYLKKTIKHSKIILYKDLGTEAIRKLEVEQFPVTVINDIYGNDLYIQGREKYKLET
ncbi:fumarate hydratase [Natranaerobius trueperi]|uniref:Fumarate hydratase n=1 Tax=Natranaerobius trueperi TaxID=759412 RepID=A0A226BZA5_9FIRM|nr:fumarate hydratase [Natranaerobius trueperi]